MNLQKYEYQASLPQGFRSLPILTENKENTDLRVYSSVCDTFDL